MPEIDKKGLQHIANLARIEIKDEKELDILAEKVEEVIEHSKELAALDLSDVEPLTHPIELFDVTREDVVDGAVSQEDALKNSQSTADGQFKVPNMLS